MKGDEITSAERHQDSCPWSHLLSHLHNLRRSHCRIPVCTRAEVFAVLYIIHQNGNEIILDISWVPGSGQHMAVGFTNSNVSSDFLAAKRSRFSAGHKEQRSVTGDLVFFKFGVFFLLCLHIIYLNEHETNAFYTHVVQKTDPAGFLEQCRVSLDRSGWIVLIIARCRERRMMRLKIMNTETIQIWTSVSSLLKAITLKRFNVSERSSGWWSRLDIRFVKGLDGKIYFQGHYLYVTE